MKLEVEVEYFVYLELEIQRAKFKTIKKTGRIRMPTAEEELTPYMRLIDWTIGCRDVERKVTQHGSVISGYLVQDEKALKKGEKKLPPLRFFLEK
jgi:hypothetical protein